MAAITMAKVNNATWSRSPDGWSSTVWFCILWSHIGHIPDLLAQVLLPLLTSGEMEGISGGEGYETFQTSVRDFKSTRDF